LSTLQIPTARAFAPLLNPARYKGAFGGRGSGKSHFFANLIVRDSIKEPGDSGGEGLRTVCIREIQKDLTQSAKLLIEDKLTANRLGEADGFKVFRDVIQTPGDGIIIFKGMQEYTAESVKSLEKFKRAWWEEAQTAQAGSLAMLRPTIREDGSELWFSWNPRRKTDPVDALLRGPVPPTGAVVVKANWKDNPWLPKVLEQERLDCLANDPTQYDHIWEGGYAVISAGSFYGTEIARARSESRITRVPYDRYLPVMTGWDLGFTDSTAIWFIQVAGNEVHAIDYYEADSKPLSHYADVLRQKAAQWGEGFRWGEQFFPHDVRAHELSTGKSRVQTLNELGIEPTIVPQHNVNDGINATRRIFDRMWIDAERCERGIEAISLYRRDYDDKAQMFKDKPLHDWASHGADALRCFAAGWDGNSARPQDNKVDRHRRRLYGKTGGSAMVA
jgi:phage terminase large subunit